MSDNNDSLVMETLTKVHNTQCFCAADVGMEYYQSGSYSGTRFKPLSFAQTHRGKNHIYVSSGSVFQCWSQIIITFSRIRLEMSAQGGGGWILE